MSIFKSIYNVKVSFEDLDPLGIVWHGNYMRYLEQARCDMLSKLNYTYNNMSADGYAYPIAKLDVKYIKPASFEDVLTVESELISIEPSMNIKYVIYNAKTEERIFEASSMQIAININSRESIYDPPKGLIEAVKKVSSAKV